MSANGISRIASISRKLVSGVGFSYGWAEFAFKKAAAVGAQFLDRLLRGDRPHRQRLGLRGHRLRDGVACSVLDRIAGRIDLRILIGNLLDGRHVLVAIEILDDALAGQDRAPAPRRAAAGHKA